MKNKIQTLIERYGKGSSLKARTARGSAWLAAGSGIEQGLRLVRNMILTRVLAPEVFGTMAIIFAINAFFQSFTYIGIREAIIQNTEGDQDPYLNGAWWLSLGRSLVLYAIAFVGAPLIAGFYENPELVPMLRVAFTSLFFRGIMSVKAYVAIKDFEFKKWIFIEQTGGAVGVLVTIGLTFAYHNVWALVFGFTFEAVAGTILSYLICPYLPRLKFNQKQFKSLLHFVRGMLGLPILTFIYMRIDIFFIGKLHSNSELGLYNMVANLAKIPSLLITKFISPLFMPAFSKIQDDNLRINKSIIEINTVFSYIGIPIIIFIILFAKPVLSVVYTSQYAQASIPFSILFTAAMLQNFSRPIVSVYLAKGNPGMLRAITGLRAFLVAALMYPAIKLFGLTGASLAVLFSMLVFQFVLIDRVRKITQLKLLYYLLPFVIALPLSVPIVTVRCLLFIFFTYNSFLFLACGVGSLVLSYVMVKMLHIWIKNTVEKILKVAEV